MDDNAAIREACNKLGDLRSFDDILIIKSRLSRIAFFSQLFSAMLPNQVNDICRGVQLELVEEGEYVFKQGAFGDKFFAILKGKCEVRINQENNETKEMEEITVHTCVAGDYFGERALENDEPRSASIVSIEGRTELISMHRKSYKNAIKEKNENEAQISLKEGTKAYTLRVLGKRSDDRSEEELVNVAFYLDKRVNYFKKFSKKQQVELARASQLISIFGKNILFKQGQTGQAFYILMSGTAEVIVSAPGMESSGNSEGMVVNVLQAGAAFGERALESDEGRSATIVTGDGLNEMLVIAKDDYHTLIAELVKKERMEKTRVLQRTNAFRDLNTEDLEALGKLMEPATYLVDTFIYKQDDKATDLIFIETGEAQVSLQVIDNDTTEYTVDLGRVGPYCMLGEYIALQESMLIECDYRETITTTSFVAGYKIAKSDLFFQLPKETLNNVRKAIRYAETPSTPLFENTIRLIDKKEFKKNRTWLAFRNALVTGRSSKNDGILENKQVMEKLNLNDNVGNYRKLPPSPREIMANKVKAIPPLEQQQNHIKKMISDNLGVDTSFMKKDPKMATGFTSMHKKKKTTKSAEQDKKEKPTGPGAPVLPAGYVMSNGCFKYPFALIHLHREMTSKTDTAASRRPLSIYARVCGTMNTAGAIKDGAESMISHCFIHEYHGDPSVESSLKLNWKVFTDFSNLPHQHTDVFLIYCRTAVLEFAVLTPPKNFLRMEYPFACRYDNQFFGCISIKDISSAYEVTESESSRFLKEISCIHTVQGTFGAEIDAAKFARTTARPPPYDGRLCIIPMYDWLLVNEDTFAKYDVTLTSQALQKQNPDIFMYRTGSQTVLQLGLSGQLKGYDDNNDDRSISTASTYDPQSPRRQYQQHLQSQSQSQLQKSLNLDGSINTHNYAFNQSNNSYNITNTTSTTTSNGGIYNLDNNDNSDVIQENIEGFDTLPPLQEAMKTLNRTLLEYGMQSTNDVITKSKGLGLLKHSKSLSALNSDAQIKNISRTVDKKARESGKLYHSHHMHNREHQQRREFQHRKAYLAKLDHDKLGNNNDNNDIEEKGPDLAELAKESQRHLKDEKAKAEDKAAALSGVISARMNVLKLNHELLNIESLIAQDRNERFERKEKEHWIQLGVKETKPITTNKNNTNGDSNDDDEGDNDGRLDVEAVPRGLRYAIKSDSETNLKRVDRALADKRVQLAEAIVNLPSAGVLRKEIKVKREKEEQKQYSKAKILAKKLEQLQHHPLHHHHHSTKHDHHSGNTPRIDQMQSMLMESATTHALNSPGGDSTSSGSSSTSSSSSVSTEHQDETGNRLYLSYTKPDIQHHHHHHIHKFTLKEKIIALDDMIADNAQSDELFRTTRTVRN